MFPLSLYLLHQVHLCSHLLYPSTATVHPTSLQGSLSWIMKSNLLLSLGPLLLNPFPMLFFLLKADGIFSSFQSLLPHTSQVLLTCLTSFPLHCSHDSLPDHQSPTIPLSVYWSRLLSLAASCLGSGYILEYVTFTWWLQEDIDSCSLLVMQLQQGHAVLPGSALLYGCPAGLLLCCHQ